MELGDPEKKENDKKAKMKVGLGWNERARARHK